MSSSDVRTDFAGSREGAGTAIFTVVSNNYLHFARTLLASVRAAHPDADLFCVIVDRDLGPGAALSKEFSVIKLDELDLPDGEKFFFQYNVLELNTAVKPWAFKRLLDLNYCNVIYIDPDIRLYRGMDEVNGELAGGADIIITPHLLAPMTDDKRPSELDIRRSGTYNFGFCAVRNTANTLAFIEWWQSKLKHGCIIALNEGIFVDQSWIDLVPGLFERVSILRHAGYNVAYWNLAQRRLAFGHDQWTVNGQPLVFFHYSGLDPANLKPFSKHQNRFTLDTVGPAAALITAYAKELHGNGFKKYSQMKYGFGYFNDGEKIPAFLNELYRENVSLRDTMGDQPFARSDILLEEARSIGDVNISWAMLALWNCRADLQAVFPLATRESARDYRNWFSHECGAYYSKAVINFHNRPLDSQAGGEEPIADTSAKADPDFAAVNRVQTMFSAILGRFPEPEAIDVFSRMISRRQGRFRTWKAMAFSRENRARPGWLRRSWKGLRIALDKYAPTSFALPVDQSLLPAPTPDAIMVAEPDAVIESTPGPDLLEPWIASRIAELHNRPARFWLHSDVESRANGHWTTSTVRLSLPEAAAGSLVRIDGIYPANQIAKQHGESKGDLAVLLRQQVLYVESLPETDGEFSIEFSLPAELGSRPHLNILTEKYFIPCEIGDSDDGRELAIRLKKVTAGEQTIFDYTRDEPVMFGAKELPPPGINLVAYIKSEHGVGEAARSLASSARGAGIPYSLIDVGYQTGHRQSDGSALDGAVAGKQAIDILYVNADQTPSTLNHLRKIGHDARFRIGIWAWEQPVFPDRFLGSFSGLNEIWVPSSFVQGAVSALAPVPVLKVPHAVRFVTPPAPNRERFGLPSRDFLALVMYDFHSFHHRKNPEAAIAAFRQGLAGRKNATLVIKTIGYIDHLKDYQKLQAAVADIPNVIFINKSLGREQIYELQACCDVLLSLHRAEGFGLALAEMMYLGKPVIATGWSGNMDFMTATNSYPVQYELTPLEKAHGPYEAGPVWADADIEHAGWCLRQLIDNPSEAEQKGRQAARDIRSMLSPEVVGQQMRDRLNFVADWYGIA